MKKSTAPVVIALALLVLSAAAAVAVSTPSPTAPAPQAASAAPSAAPPPAAAPSVAAALPGRGAPLLAAIFGDNAGADPARPVPAQIGNCGPRQYSCRPCTDGLELCYTQICGVFVIEHCDACEPECFLPPS